MRGRWLIGTWILLLMACVHGESRAAAPTMFAFAAKAEASEGAHPPEGKELNVFKGGLDLTIWSIVVFLALYFILSKFAWPSIREGLDKREQSIAHDKQEAEKAKREATEVKAKLEAEMARVNAEIRTMMDKARVDAAATTAEELARGKAELQAERERQQRELRIATDDALHKIWATAAQLATSISAKAVRKQLNYDDHRALLAEALDEFQASAGARLDDLRSAQA
jgi:F-type H+-transporting ATPase subunit b